jgi:hemerythrin superfamily protein
MAISKKTAGAKKGKKANAQQKTASGKSAAGKSAVDILKQDHAEVQAIFKQYRQLMKSGGSAREKRVLARKACDMLTIHALVEEELFYPVVREAMMESELMNEALVEHDGAKQLIAQLRRMSPDDEFFDATFVVLSEQVKHHIREEEGKIFPKAKKTGLNLQKLGRDLEAFKHELEQDRRSYYGEPALRAGGGEFEQGGAMGEQGMQTAASASLMH